MTRNIPQNKIYVLVVKARTLEAKTKAKDRDPQGQDQGRGHGPQGQGQSSQGRGQGQGQAFLSSRILEAKACPRGLHHWYYPSWHCGYMSHCASLKQQGVSVLTSTECINYFVHLQLKHTIWSCAFNVDNCKIIESILPHGALQIYFHSPKYRSTLNDRSTKHEVAGITVSMNDTFQNRGRTLSRL